MWGWVKHLFGLDVRGRVRALEISMANNAGAIDGAVAAFKQFAEGGKK